MEQPIAPAPPTTYQSAIFQRLRWSIVRNTLAAALRGSLLRLSIILVCSLVIWGGIFLVSVAGFHFLQSNRIPLAGGIVGMLFDFLFVALAILLVFSSGIILYSSLFSAAETSFLLSMPAAADQVFAYKFQGAVTFSSWAFVLLGSPMLVAYGLAFSVPWYFYLLLPFFFLGFVLLPGGIGALICLLMVNYLPHRPKQILALVLVLGTIALTFWIHSIRPTEWNELDRNFVQRMVGHFALAQSPLSPNHWLSQGIQAAARRDVGKLFYYLALLWSNGLFLYVLVTWAAARLYRRGYDRIAGGGGLRRRYSGIWIDRALTGLVRFLDPQMRLLIVKDFRTFRRDPAQWAQVLIFTGLMVLYFANIRRFYEQHEISHAYQNGVSLMNLTATALLLCAYTGRFIFPMLSLEGRKFWILGLLPLRRDRLLWGKFAFAATWSLLTAEFLVIFSDFMLGIPGFLTVLHSVTVAVLALGLSGLSVGLGAWMPNFRESDPSKIAVGFGGTLNLIVSLLFLLLIVGCMAAPLHLQLAAQESVRLPFISGWWLVIGIAAGMAIGLLAVIVPLRIGARVLRRMEF